MLRSEAEKRNRGKLVREKPSGVLGDIDLLRHRRRHMMQWSGGGAHPEMWHEH